MSYGIKINLLSLKGATICPIHGEHATKDCVIIPIEDAGLHVGVKGVYLNLNANIRSEAVIKGWQYVLRLNIRKTDYDKLTHEERNAIPTVGVMRSLKHEVADTDNSSNDEPMGDLFDTSLLGF